ncbi:MAG: hypothetical protein JNJ89_12820 [Rubrivivax sp.]|nr:hypothetical protein [Rubrivivax sp.]
MAASLLARETSVQPGGSGGPMRQTKQVLQARWVLAWALLAMVAAAHADRPFVATTSAAAEEDDDRVWSLSSWAQRDKRLGALGVSAEYAFEPRLSTEFAFVRSRPRMPGAETSLEAEGEVKWLYNNIARDGWGVGVSLGLGASKDGDAAWRGGSWQVVVPFSWQFNEAGGLVHLNAGLAKERGERRESLASAAVEWPIAPRVSLFAEWAKGGDERLEHTGARWWVKREHYAVDFSLLRRRPEGGAATTGWVLGFSVYDL